MKKCDFLFNLQCVQHELLSTIKMHGAPDEFGFNRDEPFDFTDVINKQFESLHSVASRARGAEQKAAAKKALLACMNALAERVAQLYGEKA